MATKCPRTIDLQVHHKRRDAGNDIRNAVVLCRRCHSETSTYGVPGKSPEPFTPLTKLMARVLAKGRCQCTSDRGCH